ncbi:MAG: DNA-directed RNA polymerase subunit beta [candidate division WOR-3 bacterium]|nr:DNA-directed RNA polymerase subunit beta [candidate division WOR-3 bacterium]
MTSKRKFFWDLSKRTQLDKLNFDLPNFLSVQRDSFERFIQWKYNDEPENRPNRGLESVFREAFPIEDIHGRYKLEYLYYHIEEPRYTPEQATEKELTYSAPLYGRFRLIEYEEPEESLISEEIDDFEPIREVKQSLEQDVFLVNIPVMTERGDFIINGNKRVIISQLHRAPGVYFEEEKIDEVRSKYTAQIIPDRGSWLRFSIKLNEAMKTNLNGRRNFSITILIKALGCLEDIKELEKERKTLLHRLGEKGYKEKLITRIHKIDKGIKEVEGRWNTKEDILSIFFDSKEIKLDEDALGKYLAKDIVAEETGEVLSQSGDKLDGGKIEELKSDGIKCISVLSGVEKNSPAYLLNALQKDKTKNGREALLQIYRYLRGTDAPSLKIAKDYFHSSFFDSRKFNLSRVGRHVLNRKLNEKVDGEELALVPLDFLNTIKGLMELANGKRGEDDIDHLGNRRVKTVGEQLENQFRIALSRMVRTITERMIVSENENITPKELINTRQIVGVLNSFFATGQLSQFLDQTNPLAELTNKRRLSALGPGGLTRDTAGFAVRDVHYSHYGRICPIETPEGPNIGLIASLASISRVNEDGFIETPYRKVKDGVITNKVEYLDVNVEDQYTIAPANLKVDKNNKIVEEYVVARRKDSYPLVKREEVDYVDFLPQQLVSVSSSLIPFLEHDDVNRALMGSNMQRQAVPLIKPEAPLVGTGMEEKAARDSGAVVVAKRKGVVHKVTSDEIWIKTNKELAVEPYDIYYLQKFERTNQNTCINQRPIVEKGQKVKKGDIIADGAATDHGELALGQNVLVAFIPYFGWNYEDAIVISERLLKEDTFSSYHIEEYTCEVRDTKLGPEETTGEIPNVSEEDVANLDGEGIVRTGAAIREGDILVGKVSPKGETELTPEEKLLRAIFGKKAEDVKDTSLRVPSGVHGVVIGSVVLERKARKDKLDRVAEEYDTRIKELKKRRLSIIREKLLGKKAKETLYITEKDKKTGKETEKLLVRRNQKFKEKHIKKLDQWKELKGYEKVQKFIKETNYAIKRLEKKRMDALSITERGDELSAGVSKLVKVYIGQRRKISIGDKLSGRHGNKGVVARIVPEEDMPYTGDGRPVDVALNPLGVPSRMNVGQILETHLGWAAHKLNMMVGSPVFEGVPVPKIKELLRKAGLPENGKVSLYDGRSGEPFDQEITIGYIYMMKLYHMIEDKHHTRATGPYSLITQQPLGGKAQYGGQRFGEMEVWALEGYGAARTLQEMLTIKSDDVEGRNKAYEAIVKGEVLPEPKLPTSFDVLVKELQGLGLNVELLKEDEEEKYEI